MSSFKAWNSKAFPYRMVRKLLAQFSKQVFNNLGMGVRAGIKGGILGLLIFAEFFGYAFGRLSQEEILNGLLKNYNNRFRPLSRESNETTVFVNMKIRDIEFINDIKMEYAVQLTFRQEWRDHRLIYNPGDYEGNYITLTESKRIWIPDLFFTNEKSGNLHDIMMPNVYVRIFPTGDVLYSTRISLVLSCPMALQTFPHDRQTCSIRMSSFGHISEDIVLKWRGGDPVQAPPYVNLKNFALEKIATESCESQTITGVYSCLRVDFLFQRYFHHYLVHVYIPTASLVILAWLSFWVTKKDVMGRLLVTLISHGLLIYIVKEFNATLPQVSYSRAMDYWTGTCLTFTMFSIAEFVLVHFLSRANDEVEEGELKEVSLKHSANPDKLDKFCRIFYPVAFFVFVCFYAVKFILSSGIEN